MLDLKRPKSIFVFSEKWNLNIVQSYEEKFGIKKEKTKQRAFINHIMKKQERLNKLN